MRNNSIAPCVAPKTPNIKIADTSLVVTLAVVRLELPACLSCSIISLLCRADSCSVTIDGQSVSDEPTRIGDEPAWWGQEPRNISLLLLGTRKSDRIRMADRGGQRPTPAVLPHA